MPLKPVETKKVYLRVVEQIRQMIAGGELSPGDQLPTTAELAEALQVSRPTVREALAALEILGLVESKPGSGSYVTPAALRERLPAERKPVAEPWASAEEILEARLAYEPACARYAAQRRTPADLQEMRCTPELLMVDIERVADGLPARFGGCQSPPSLPPENFQVSLHAVIARATHNPLLAAFGDVISRAVRSPTWQRIMRQIYLSPRNTSFFLKQYEELYDAIERGDGPAAETLMRQHLLALSQTLNEG
jgi:GntR family transcriptional repressor for pyruvate dehydrogenase complex